MSSRNAACDGFPSDEPTAPLLDRGPYAVRVAQMFVDSHATNRSREMVRAAHTEGQERIRARDAWNKHVQDHVEKAWKRQQQGYEEPTESPAEGWTWGGARILTERGRELSKQGKSESVLVFTWMPPELSSDKTPRTGVFLPLSTDRPLSLAECYTLLAAIHDTTLVGVQPINPWDGPQTPSYYVILLERARELRTTDEACLQVILQRVQDDLQRVQDDLRGDPEYIGFHNHR